jgi:hypothetical protein
MTPSPARPRPIGQVPFPSADFWHLAPRPAKSRVGFKEWSHFSVLGGDFDLLVNFSVMTESEGASPRSTPRLTLLVRAPDGHWDGDVEVFNRVDTTILPGLPDAVFGRNSARFIGPHYRVEAELSSRAVSAALDLHPMTQPVIANQSRLSDAESFSWMVVSHLRAEGELNVSARRYRITDAPAYHDRNWGCFMWGGSYAWEWAIILPPEALQPWCLVYSRFRDVHRGATRSQSLLLWRREFLCRKFYGRDLSISHRGLLRRERVLRLPRIASLLMPGVAADVPQEILVSARGYGDELDLRMSFDDFAQVVVPNDRWPGFTLLCEIQGRAEVTARIGGERIAFEGRVQAELNHVSR